MICQEIPRVTGKFSTGVQNEAGQRLTEECTGHGKHSSSNKSRDNYTHGHHRWSVPKLD